MSSRGRVNNANLDAELVVVGGGGAGMTAAVTAAENGASEVIVLDKRGIGGNTARATGPMAVDSPAQKRMAIEFRLDEVFKIAMNYAHWKTNPRIVRAYLEKSGDTIRWLEDKGLSFKVLPFYHNQNPLIWHVPKGKGAEVIKVLTDDAKKMGVKLLTYTPAKKILTSAKGEVIGVMAKTKEGGELIIKSEIVVISTGGYGGSQRLLRKYCSNYDDIGYAGVPQNTGDGLLMATDIGAATEGLGFLMMAGPMPSMRERMKLGSIPGALEMPLVGLAMDPQTIWVNKKGERFVDEGIAGNHYIAGNAINRQPDSTCYTLLDHKLVKYKEEFGVMIGFGGPGEKVQHRISLPGLERELRKQADKGFLKIDDSWDGIADYIGVAPEVLKATIDEYNSLCGHGYDPIFNKERVLLLPLLTPPYYAIRASVSITDTIGGIKINERMEVLDKRDKPIPGLYAAGVTTGGWQANTYCAVLSGTAFGFALNSGRIAGENAVKFCIRTKKS